jgi:hypothetical protein
MPLPGFDYETGRLPEGEHLASWEEVVERLGWNARRRRLLDELADAIDLLQAAGCRRIWLNGGEFFPNVVEAASGLVFAEFFQNERDTGRKGIIVLDIKEAAR